MAVHFTINNIHDLLESYVTNNKQIKRFGFGYYPDLEEMIQQSQEFPLLFATVERVSYPFMNQKTYNLSILVIDLLANDKTNERDVWSDSTQQLEDLYRYLVYNQNNYYDIQGTPDITLVTEKLSDFVAGGKMSLSFNVDFEQNDCGIAENGFNFQVPSFLPYPNQSSGSTFDCSDLLNCSSFTTLQQQILTKSDLSGSTFTGGIYAPSVSGATIYSGSTNLYDIFSTTDDNDITRVQPGVNIITGGTANNPIVNLVDSPSINNLSFSGLASGGNINAGTITGSTYYSGSTLLQTIINNSAFTGLTVSSTTINNGSNNAVLFQSGTTLYEDGSNFVWDNQNKRLGIGTVAPQALLHAERTTSNVYTYPNVATNQGLFRTLNSTNTANQYAGVSFSVSTDNNVSNATASIGVMQPTFNSGAGNMLFFTRLGSGGVTEKMRITSDGNFGVGLQTPTATVHIKGAGSTSATSALKIDNSSNTNLVTVLNDGKVGISNATPLATKLDIVDNTITSGNVMSITSSTITTGSMLKLASTSTVGNGSKMLEITSTGNNTTASKTNYGVHSTVGHYQGGGSTDIAGYFLGVSYGDASNVYGVQGIAGNGGGNANTSAGGYFQNTAGRNGVSTNYGVYASNTSNSGGINSYGAYFLNQATVNTLSCGVFAQEQAETATGLIHYGGYFITGVGVGAGANTNKFYGVRTLATATATGSTAYGAFLEVSGSGTKYGLIVSGGSVGIGTETPTAKIHIASGATTANSAPLKFSSGSSLTVVENGSVEYDGIDYFVSALGTRQNLNKGLSGSFSQIGAATTVFTVTFGGTQPNSTYKINVTPTNLLAAAAFYVTNKTSTTFDVTYIAGLTGTVTFDWILTQ